MFVSAARVLGPGVSLFLTGVRHPLNLGCGRCGRGVTVRERRCGLWARARARARDRAAPTGPRLLIHRPASAADDSQLRKKQGLKKSI